MKYIIYCTTCLINGKIYIGVHKTENPDEFDGYIGNGIDRKAGLKHPKTPFQYAVKKYGKKNFRRATLFEYETSEEAYNKERELVTPEFIRRKDNYNCCVGGMGGKLPKKIYRYDLSGHLMEEFSCMDDVRECKGYDDNNVWAAIRNKRSYKESFWAFDSLDTFNIEDYKLNLFSTIYQYDLKGNLVGKYETTKEICEKYGMTFKTLVDAMTRCKVSKGYFFTKNPEKLKDTLIHLEKIQPVLPGTKKQIAQYTLNGDLVKVWDSIKECRKEFSKCLDVAKGLRTSTKGYTFKYYTC